MTLPPKAIRLIDAAATTVLGQPDIDLWHAWALGPTTSDLPYEIAHIAFKALTAEAQRIEAQLVGTEADDNAEADLINDLAFVNAVRSGLDREGVGR